MKGLFVCDKGCCGFRHLTCSPLLFVPFAFPPSFCCLSNKKGRGVVLLAVLARVVCSTGSGASNKKICATCPLPLSPLTCPPPCAWVVCYDVGMIYNQNWAVTDTRLSGNYWKGRSAPVSHITVHHWGSFGQDHDGVVNYLCRLNGDTSAHYVVSDGRVTQLVSDLDTAWHAYTGNAGGIGVECRPELSWGDFVSVARLVAAIRGQHGYLPLTGHRDWSATECPGLWYARLHELDVLAEKIRAGGVIEPDENQNDNDQNQNIDPFSPVPGDRLRLRPPVLVEPGTTQLEIDGSFGPKSVSRLQVVMGTTVDGVLSEPSDVIMALQSYLNSQVSAGQVHDLGADGSVWGRLDVDGLFGPKSVMVFQWWAWHVRYDLVGYYAFGWSRDRWCDGSFGPKSVMVLQHVLCEAVSGSGSLGQGVWPAAAG